MKVIKTKVLGVEVFQVVKDGQVICQRYSLAGIKTWLMTLNQ